MPPSTRALTTRRVVASGSPVIRAIPVSDRRPPPLNASRTELIFATADRSAGSGRGAMWVASRDTVAAFVIADRALGFMSAYEPDRLWVDAVTSEWETFRGLPCRRLRRRAR